MGLSEMRTAPFKIAELRFNRPHNPSGRKTLKLLSPFVCRDVTGVNSQRARSNGVGALWLRSYGIRGHETVVAGN